MQDVLGRGTLELGWPVPAAPVHVVGGGLAGSEAAWQLASAGVPVILHEMRPLRRTDAHKTGHLAELVCSNSFRSDDPLNNAVGLLHEEMRRLGSLIMAAGDHHRLPAGGALAVDRERFAHAVQRSLEEHPLVEIRRELVPGLPPASWGQTIVATGPLTAPELAADIARVAGQDHLAFFDAIAPIVHRDSIDMEVAWLQSRYDKGAAQPGAEKGAPAPGPGGEPAPPAGDYINCPLDRAQYQRFIDALLAADTTEFRDFEKATPYFEGCLPIEVMAARGPETLRFGPMKPVGLLDPRTGRRPFAVAQLRQDNALGTLWNMVGFQTKLRHGEQARVFRLIPGLEQAQFARLGGLHRNTFINSPTLLAADLRFKPLPHLRFAGQVTGVEGYVESAAVGLMAGRFAAAEAYGQSLAPPPPETAHGSLLAHITGGADARTFQPMNVNFGLLPPPPEGTPRERRKQAQAQRALAAIDTWAPGAGTPVSFPCQRAKIG